MFAFFSFLFYFFLTKRHDVWKFTKIRPSFDESDKISELYPIDWILKYESFFSTVTDNFENNSTYINFLLDSDYEYEVIDKVQSAIDKDKIIIELENFMDHEVTERWNSSYGVYVNPKNVWYS